jgi:hypothetical protein
MVELNQNTNNQLTQLPNQMPAVANNLAGANLAQAGANPILPTNPELAVNEHGAIGVEREDLNESQVTKFFRSGVSIAELLAATPLVFTSLLNQADNISKQGARASDSGLVGFLITVVDTLSRPFRFLVDRYVVKSDAPNNVKVNKRAFVLDDLFQRVLHPNISKEFTSFLFTFRRSVFNLMPNLFKVPSEEHNPNEAEGKRAKVLPTALFSSLAKSTSPLRLFSSLIGLLVLSPAKLLSSVFAFTGNQKLYDASKEFSKITKYFDPIIANLSSAYSTAKAFFDSYAKGESTIVTFGKYNITRVNAFQGLFGGLLSIPQFFGAIAKVRNSLAEKNDDQEYKIIKPVRDFVEEIAPFLKEIKIFSNETVAGMQEQASSFVTKVLDSSFAGFSRFAHSIFNATPFVSNALGTIKPRDLGGNVVVSGNSTSFPLDDSENKYFASTIRKANFFSEIYDLLNPIQSLLMLLPNVFVSIDDPYVTDNAVKPVRMFDRLIGINSVLLSAPNFLVYSLSTRAPQMILKFFELKQRKADSEGNPNNYSAYDDYQSFIERLKVLPILGVDYLAGILEKLDLDPEIFKEHELMKLKYDEVELNAQSQEPSVMASELLGAIRIGLRTLLSMGWFKTERDETGLTAEEQSRLRIYNSLGTFKEGIVRIPVIGLIASPIIEMFRGMYKVDTKKDRKRLPGFQPTRNPVLNNPALNMPAAVKS